MAQKYFFSPTLPKVIIPLSLIPIFIFISFQMFCCLPLIDRFILAAGDPENMGVALFLMLISYYFSCSAVYFLGDSNKGKKK